MIFGKSAFTLGVYETSLRHANLTFTFKCGMPGSEFLLYYISQCCAMCAWGTDLQLMPLVTVVAIWMGVMNCLHQMSDLLKLIHLTGRNHCDKTLNWIMILWNSNKSKHKSIIWTPHSIPPLEIQISRLSSRFYDWPSSLKRDHPLVFPMTLHG